VRSPSLHHAASYYNLVYWVQIASPVTLNATLTVVGQDCPIPPPLNGNLGACPPGLLRSGTSCNVGCNSGFVLFSPTNSPTSCVSGVVYSDQVCNVEYCIVTAPNHGTLGAACANGYLPALSSCAMQCNPTYYLLGAPVSCSGVGVASASPTCVPCPQPTPPANANQGTCTQAMNNGDTCQLGCNSGYSLVGAATTCSGGALTYQSCAANSCPVTAPANGGVGNCPPTLPPGGSCNFTCNPHYQLDGAATQCVGGVLLAQQCDGGPGMGAITNVVHAINPNTGARRDLVYFTPGAAFAFNVTNYTVSTASTGAPTITTYGLQSPITVGRGMTHTQRRDGAGARPSGGCVAGRGSHAC
jgi:hypothetical protein